VVITHHVPTFINAPQKYRGSALHEALGVELSDLIKSTGPDYWIYGHIHRNNPEFKIGKTTLLTNQLGYVMKDEHHLFNTHKTITL
jgi:Icc-related predicted phosphoesterase